MADLDARLADARAAVERDRDCWRALRRESKARLAAASAAADSAAALVLFLQGRHDSPLPPVATHATTD